MKPENAREQLEKMIKDQSIVRVSHLRPIAKNLISYIKIIENDNDHLRKRIAEQNGLIKRQRNALARLNDQVAQMKDENELYREALEYYADKRKYFEENHGNIVHPDYRTEIEDECGELARKALEANQ